MSISRMSNGSCLGAELATDAEASSNNGNNNNHHHRLTNGDTGGDDHAADPDGDGADRVTRGGSATAEDRLRLVSPAPPPLKVDTGQGRMERDRDRDWAASKVGPNYGVALVNNSNGSATADGSREAASKGGSNRPSHNHHPLQQPIAGNLALNKTSGSSSGGKNHVSHVSTGVKFKVPSWKFDTKPTEGLLWGRVAGNTAECS